MLTFQRNLRHSAAPLETRAAHRSRSLLPAPSPHQDRSTLRPSRVPHASRGATVPIFQRYLRHSAAPLETRATSRSDRPLTRSRRTTHPSRALRAVRHVRAPISQRNPRHSAATLVRRSRIAREAIRTSFLLRLLRTALTPSRAWRRILQRYPRHSAASLAMAQTSLSIPPPTLPPRVAPTPPPWLSLLTGVKPPFHRIWPHSAAPSMASLTPRLLGSPVKRPRPLSPLAAMARGPK